MKTDTLIKVLARAGYAARGVVYFIIGLFAVLAAIGSTAPKGSEGALQVLLRQPAGTVLVWLMIAGLAGYSTWRLVQALGDTDDHGHSPKGLAIRTGLIGSAATYALLGLFAVGLVTSGSGDGDHGGASGLIEAYRQAFSHRIALFAVAAILAGVGIAHIFKAIREKFRRHFNADADVMAYIVPISKVGLIARGLVFLLLAVMLATARGNDGAEPPRTVDALEFLQSLPFGAILLLACGAGLLAFAAYSLIESVYRRVRPERALG